MEDIDLNVGDIIDLIYSGKSTNEDIGMLYKNTNEDLTKILTQYDFKDKDVLSVMASGDQVLSSYYLGAKTVDTFDVNKLAYYFYFLKKWIILSQEKYYIPTNNEELIQALNCHDNSTIEKQLAYYWKMVLNMLGPNSLDYSCLFYQQGETFGVPYKDDISTMCRIIQTRQPSFKHLNLYEPIDTDKTYDIIILSNILEYMSELEDKNIEKTVADNLYKLLNKDGIAICTNILEYEHEYNEIFDELFEYEPGKMWYTPLYNMNVPISYIYRKR